jgi:hypothetical protein
VRRNKKEIRPQFTVASKYWPTGEIRPLQRERFGDGIVLTTPGAATRAGDRLTLSWLHPGADDLAAGGQIRRLQPPLQAQVTRCQRANARARNDRPPAARSTRRPAKAVSDVPRVGLRPLPRLTPRS